MNDRKTAQEVPQFAHVLAHINRGALADELAVELARLVQEVGHIGRKGTLTLAIEIAPYTGNGDNVNLSAKVTVKPPARDPHGSVFFYSEDGALSRNDPRMNALFDDNGSPA